jgi:hypothetical protein
MTLRQHLPQWRRSKKHAVAVALVCLGAAPAAHALVPVIDAAMIAVGNLINASVQSVNSSVQSVNQSIKSMDKSVQDLLQKVGTAVNQNGTKIANTVEAASRSEREFMTAQERNRRLEDARQRYHVASSICSEATSGGVVQVQAGAISSKGTLRASGGHSISNASIAQAVNSPAVPQEIDASRAAQVHAQFCDADDHAAYGGSKACPAVSTTMPGADRRIDSVWQGAGPNGKAPDLTFSQAQTDAALMYVQNGVRRSIGTQLRKGEADTLAGAQYVGLLTQFNAISSAAADPLEQQIAESTPSDSTKPLLQETLNSPSAKAYYQQTASPKARTNGVMSAREFEAFEVGRRYANTDYQADLQALAGDNLLREQIRVQTLTNWLLLGIKTELRRGTVINGMTLASTSRQEFEPIVHQKYRAVAGNLGGK